MEKPTKQNFRIALVGVEFEENLSLRYLAGSLLAGGYENVQVLRYNSLEQAEALADSIIKADIDLVGVSMAFQARAIDDMALVQLLRKRGFTKHIIAGGQFATLHYAEIFSDCTGLDSIVRFEAEQAIVELADVLREGKDLRHAPALVWKDEQGQLHLNGCTTSPGELDELPLPLRKDSPSEYLGLKNIHMIGSRGCHATCKYCCVSALAADRRNAAKEAGGSALPGTRRRCARSVAEEIAYLYFEKGIRIFEFQDDNWIHPKVPVASEYFTELKNELAVRGVGRIGLTLKTRADSVQPEIIQALKEIGLIRVFVGIESGTQNLLVRLGRTSGDNASIRALQVLREHGVPAYFNALLFGPDIRFEDIEPELQFLEQCTDFPFEIVEVVIYGRTCLYESLKKQNRLYGNYLDYGYDYLDERTQHAHTLISKLETRHFGVYSPVKMAADLGFNLGIMQVFYPGPETDRLAEKVKALTRRINEDQIRVIRKAAKLATEGLTTEGQKELIAETVSRDLQFYGEIIGLHREMERRVAAILRSDNVSSYYRTGAMVQSALIAGIFLLSLGNALGQDNAPDPRLQKQLQELVGDYDEDKWKAVKSELLNSRIPIDGYIADMHKTLDSVARTEEEEKLTEAGKNRKKLTGKLNSLEEERIKNDYKRLTDLLQEHNPKIRIASALAICVDGNGHVTHVFINKPGGEEKLSPELRQVILDLLKEKKFYTYELRNKCYDPRGREIRLRQRRGPLD